MLENNALSVVITSLAACCHMTWYHTSWSQAISRLIAIVIIFLKIAAEDGVKRRGRYKEYLRHHNPYRVGAARTRHQRRNSRKTDPVPDKPQSVNNGSFPEFKGKEVFQFCDQCNKSTLLLSNTSLVCVSI